MCKNHLKVLLLLNVYNVYWQGLDGKFKCHVKASCMLHSVDFHLRFARGLMFLLPESLIYWDIEALRGECLYGLCKGIPTNFFFLSCCKTVISKPNSLDGT